MHKFYVTWILPLLMANGKEAANLTLFIVSEKYYMTGEG